jgi:malate permease and related proteins
MLVRILGIILPVFSVIALGWIYARRATPDLTWVNRMNMVLLGPALVFSALANKDFDIAANLPLVAGSLGVVLGSGLLAWPFAKLLHQDYRTWVPPMMFNNCGNMGLPLAYLSFGQAGLSAMVTLFTVSNFVHFTLGVHIVNRHASSWPVLKNPMVLATFFGLVFAVFHPPTPEWPMRAIKMVGDAAIPLMLISLGVRLAEARWDEWHLGVIGGLVCPLTGIAIAGLLALVIDLDRTQQGLLIIFGCLPPAVLNFMVAEQYGQEPAKVASIVLVGNMMAVLFVPLGLTLALR